MVFNFPKIEWAPLHVPHRRRIQTLAVGLYVFIFMFLPFISLFGTVYGLLYFSFVGRALLMFYLGYIIYYQIKCSSTSGGKGFLFLRKYCFTKYFRDYFPIELVKTTDLKPDRNYLIAAFPHGILSTGLSTNMGNNIAQWLQLFPGIRPKIASMNLYFYVPIIREILIALGCISCSKESILHHLKASNDPKAKHNKDGFTSNAVALAVGGWAEALDAWPGSYVIQLKKRKGFVKIAIQTGCPLVPSFSFGEVDIFNQLSNSPGSLWRKVQTLVKRITGLPPVLIVGRGFFQYSFGFLPQRRRIVQVLGAPIEVRQMDQPSAEYINEIHEKVIASLIEMFEKYKYEYIANAEKTQLEIN